MKHLISMDIQKNTHLHSGQHRPLTSLIEFCVKPRTRREMQEYVNIASREYFNKALLAPLLESRQLMMTVPDKPNSKNQKYIFANMQEKD